VIPPRLRPLEMVRTVTLLGSVDVFERIQHPDQVGRQVRAGVPRRLGWVADRLPRVTMVAPDDKSPAR
jgi:hypothetical protein